MQFNLKTAQDYANHDKLEDWIHAYLGTGYWKNIGLSDGLKLQKRWWIAPVYVPLDLLVRCCGPEPKMAYRMTQADWDRRVNKIVDNLSDVADLPPLIIQYQDDEYRISDGNHRHEAMRRKGWTHCWVVIWYNNREAWEASLYYEKAVTSRNSDE